MKEYINYSNFDIIKQYIENFVKRNSIDVQFINTDNFFGVKFFANDKYFVCFVSIYDNILTFTYRNNHYEKEVERKQIDNEFIETFEELLCTILNKNKKIHSEHDYSQKANDDGKIDNHLNKKEIKEEKNVLKYNMDKPLVNIKYLMTNRLFNCLERADILYVSQFIGLSDSKLSKIKYLGIKSFEEAKKLQKFILEKDKNKEKIYIVEKNIATQVIKSTFHNLDIGLYNMEYTEDDYERYLEFNNKIEELLMTTLSEFCVTKTKNRNVEIYKKRIGLVFSEKNTLQYIGEEYNISRERVRQIINKINRRLKKIKNEIILIINMCEERDLLNYFYDGILNVHDIAFLRCIFDIIEENEIFNDILIIEQKIKNNIKIINNNSLAQNKVLQRINFLGNCRECSLDEFDAYEVERKVEKTGLGVSGKLKLSETDEIVEYESLLEKRIISILDKAQYTQKLKTQSIKISYDINGVEHNYYPDLLLFTSKNQIIVIECKPLYEMCTTQNLIKYDALERFCKQQRYGYVMIDEHYNTIETIKEVEVPNNIEKDFLILLKENTQINYVTIKNFFAEHNMKLNLKMIMKLILKNREIIKYSTRPFYIKLI